MDVGRLQWPRPEVLEFVRDVGRAEDDVAGSCLDLFIAPVKPAEFVIFRIQQKTLEQTA